MTPQRYEDIRRVFLAVRDSPVAERAGVLEKHCAGDAALRAEVEALVARAAAPTNFMNASPFAEDGNASALGDPSAPTAVTPAPTDASRTLPGECPSTIGPYRILQLLGEGGFGSVYIAEQREPIVRRVALKILKPGMDSREVITRFEAERQALALMDHPNIARVIDGGTTDGGRPYFVMELVAGSPITAYCDQHRLNISRRLELFRDTCHAVQHAHQKGVIHRDIKPSNVLVTIIDNKPVPKVIDFGIAKAAGVRLTDKTLATQTGQFFGTPAYMSPEQAAGDGDIDTRSDVYSLGVLLYELLTGSTPFDTRTFQRAGIHEVVRLLREVDPPRPSTRVVSTLRSGTRGTVRNEPKLAGDSDGDAIAQYRQTDLGSLARQLRGELDWVVMKALEKDRSRRYGSAGELAADLSRVLRHEPVQAGPPSPAYRLRKFLRRHRTLSSAVGVIAVTLLVAMAVITRLYLRAADLATTEHQARETAQRAQDRAEGAARAEATARQHETQQRFLAEAAAHESRQTSGFLSDMLSGIGPSVALGRDVSVIKEIVDRTADRLEADLAGLPAAEGSLHLTLGRLYRELADFPAADHHLRLAHKLVAETQGNQSLPMADACFELGWLRSSQVRVDEAESLFQDATRIYETELGECHWRLSAPLRGLARLEQIRSDFAAAREHLRRAFELDVGVDTRRPRDLADLYAEYATVLSNLGDVPGAETAMRNAIAIRRSVLDVDEHPEIAVNLDELGQILYRGAKFAAAEDLFRESLAMLRKFLQPDHPRIAKVQENLALTLSDRGRFAEAGPMFLESIRVLRNRLGDEHGEVAVALHNLAGVYEQQRNFEAAEAALREAVDIESKLPGGVDNLRAVASRIRLAKVLVFGGKAQQCESVARELLPILRKAYPEPHPDTAACLDNLANSLREQNRLEEAEPLEREALEICRAARGGIHSDIALMANNLGVILRRRGKVAEAREYMSEAVTINRKLLAPGHPDLAGSLINLGTVQHLSGACVEAEASLREALAIVAPIWSEQDPRLLAARLRYGAALSCLAHFEEADKRMVDAYEGISALPGVPERTVRGAIEMLADHYAAWAAANPTEEILRLKAEWGERWAAVRPPVSPASAPAR